MGSATFNLPASPWLQPVTGSILGGALATGSSIILTGRPASLVEPVALVDQAREE